jgi:hypothetical protein
MQYVRVSIFSGGASLACAGALDNPRLHICQLENPVQYKDDMTGDLPCVEPSFFELSTHIITFGCLLEYNKMLHPSNVIYL